MKEKMSKSRSSSVPVRDVNGIQSVNMKSSCSHTSCAGVSSCTSRSSLASERSSSPTVTTAHDWEAERLAAQDIKDDGTLTFFWRGHTLTVLVLFLSVLLYVAIFDEQSNDSEYNTKRGLVACVIVFLVCGVTQIPNGPFIRPHPAFWRFVFCASLLYELALIFILFQTVEEARQLLKVLDPGLGIPLPERDYGGSCDLYDRGQPGNPWHNVLDKLDIFVPVHFFGWWLKTLILRDYWLCMVLSIMFELMEYTLEHQLPNFRECWWDHWVLDVVLCNGLGIYLGMRTLHYLNMKPYHWRGMWYIPTYRGKLQRVALQFSPYSWMSFHWRPLDSLTRFIATASIIAMFLLAEVNTFSLKAVLWVPPSHWLNALRLLAYLCWGAVALRECFQYLDDPQCVSFGRQSWVVACIIVTELAVSVRFDRGATFMRPLPRHVTLTWLAGLTALLVGIIIYFGPRPTFRRCNNMPATDVAAAAQRGENVVQEQQVEQHVTTTTSGETMNGCLVDNNNIKISPNHILPPTQEETYNSMKENRI